MSRQPITTVFGGTRIGNRPLFMPENGLEKFFDILTAHNATAIDTAQSYGDSQATIGQVKAGDRFAIDTKWSPPYQITTSATDSIRKLGVNQVDIFYLHRPDPKTPISETLSAVNSVYLRGVFRRFGLSGFPVSEIEAVYSHCVEKDYPLPTVYQGSYSPLHRYKETVLLPTLRKLGMSFYAYGPSAGGEMSRNIALVSATCRPYIGNPKFSEVLAKWNAVADGEGVSGAELAYRWVAYHSALNRENGDALIIGASSPEQLEETLNGIEKGPLSDKACAGVHDIWENIQDES
ncbi:putative aldehyde reductase [Xylariales sp. AK1849]|nr:putative aldehyde reductase [Xylariales sp. AK1849]